MIQPLPNKQFFILLYILFLVSAMSAQSVWDGGGTTTDWNDPLNWADDMVPSSDSIIEFDQDAIVTGTVSVAHPRINIKGQSNVTLDLELTIGNGTTEENSIIVGSRSTLNFASGRTFTINPPNNKQGIPLFGGTDSATVIIAADAIINIQQGTNGINLASTNSTITNNGTVNFLSTVKNGIKSSGIFVNNGTINITETETDGIQVLGGTFQNIGSIVISKTGDDGIEVVDEGMFMNMGVLNLTAKDDASSGNNPIAVGTDMAAASFVNQSSGIINASGGTGDTGRAVSINEMGTLDNFGQINLSGGTDGSRFYNRGDATNGMNGILDLDDGRANINQGNFVNNGLIKSTRDASSIFTTAEAIVTNNAFFGYAGSNTFAIGDGMITNNGINLNNNQVNINAMNACMVDIAEVPYEWSEGAAVVGTADATGLLTFPSQSISSDSVSLVTSIPGVSVNVRNICNEAVLISSVFNPVNTIPLRVFPSVLNGTEELQIDLSSFNTTNIELRIVNISGQFQQSLKLLGGDIHQILINDLPAGMYVIQAEDSNKLAIAKFMVTQ